MRKIFVMKAISLSIFSILIIAMLNSVSFNAVSQEPLLSGNQIFIFQGENEFVDIPMDNEDFYAFKIISLELPYNVSRVYYKVPINAQNITVMHISGIIGEDNYGWEQISENHSNFYVNVPSAHMRTKYYITEFANESTFTAPGSVFSNLSFSNNYMNLSNNFTEGYYESPEIPFIDSISIVDTNLSIFGTDLENVTMKASNNNGTSWVVCENNTPVEFPSNGSSLKVRLELEGNASLGYDPRISNLIITSRFIPQFTTFTIHLSYVWTQEFVDNVAVLEIEEFYEYSASGSIVLLFYAMKNYDVQGLNFQLTPSTNETALHDPTKDLYTFMQFSFDGTKLQIEITYKPQEISILWVGAGIAAVVVISLLFVFFRKKRVKEPIIEEKEGESLEKEKSDEDRKKELVSRKKELLAQMDEIKQKQSEDSIDDSEARSQLAILKGEYKKVRNELNKISRRLKVQTRQEVVSGDKPLKDEYESMLATIAKLDEDYENGRLPEETYRQLRKEYLSKAATIKAELPKEDTAFEELKRLEFEKEKLMGAIVSLEEELERGDIDEKVFDELKSSYRKQLIAVIKKIDDIKEAGGQ